MSHVFSGGREANSDIQMSSVMWHFVLIETVLKFTIQRPTCNTSIRPSSVQRVVAFDRNESKRTWIFTSSFRNLFSPLRSKEITAFLRHSEQCLFPSPQNAFRFTNLYLLVLEIFRFCEYHAQNLNTSQKNLASWDLQLGFNSAFKGLLEEWNHGVLKLTTQVLRLSMSGVMSLLPVHVFIAWTGTALSFSVSY